MPAPSAKSSLRLDAPAPRRNPAAAISREEDEFGALETLVDGFRAWLSQLPAFAGCALIVHAPLLAFAFLPDLPQAAVIAAFAVAAVVAAGVVQGALVKGVLEGERRLHSDLVELLQEAAGNGVRSAIVHLTVLGGILGRLVMLFPGVRYLCDTFVAVPALVTERASIGAALDRSARLARGARPRILAICIVPWTTAALVAASSGVFARASFDSLPWLIAFVFARALDTSLAATLAATAYSRLRDRPGA